jgi:hypothetical protein
MRCNTKSFRVGKVRAYQRGRIWYLQYVEAGQRRRKRVGPDRDQARQMAAQINGQLEVGAPSALSFEPISIPDLRQRWLDHHEHVRRSSLQTIRRYRAATEHLLCFVQKACPVRHASDFRPQHAEDFVRHLRGIQVAPNGHPHARRRSLRDAGIKYILETCSTLFNYAGTLRSRDPAVVAARSGPPSRTRPDGSRVDRARRSAAPTSRNRLSGGGDLPARAPDRAPRGYAPGGIRRRARRTTRSVWRRRPAQQSASTSRRKRSARSSWPGSAGLAVNAAVITKQISDIACSLIACRTGRETPPRNPLQNRTDSKSKAARGAAWCG